MTAHVSLIPEQHRRLGRHVEHDPRSRDYPAETGTAGAIRWRRYGAVLDQGNAGSCTGNALAGALNTVPFHRAGHIEHEPDAIRLYEAATALDDIPGTYPPVDSGSSGLAVCKAAQRAGLISAYRHAFGIDQALAALAVGPVITGVNWYEGFDAPDSEGRVSIAGKVRGGHEVEVLGYDDRTGLVEAVNSWGHGWGKAGRFFFSVDDWARLLSEQGDVTQPVPVVA